MKDWIIGKTVLILMRTARYTWEATEYLQGKLEEIDLLACDISNLALRINKNRN